MFCVFVSVLNLLTFWGLNLLNLLNGKSTWYFFGTFHCHFYGYQDENLKLISTEPCQSAWMCKLACSILVAKAGYGLFRYAGFFVAIGYKILCSKKAMLPNKNVICSFSTKVYIYSMVILLQILGKEGMSIITSLFDTELRPLIWIWNN